MGEPLAPIERAMHEIETKGLVTQSNIFWAPSADALY